MDVPGSPVRLGTAIILMLSTWLSGCAGLGNEKTNPVTVEQIVQMTRDDMPAETIVKQLRDSHDVYRLSASQLAKLHDQGVADEVIDYMQETYIQAERREEIQYQNQFCGYGLFCRPFPYLPPALIRMR
ncbi:MAG TPA: hypothetical protein VHE58_10145 [Burkholderiales bacterium]|nr:hypothetical protein [Burkholderiales bacterium]